MELKLKEVIGKASKVIKDEIVQVVKEQGLEQLQKLDKEDLNKKALDAIDKLLDSTDTPYVPDPIADPICKKIAAAVIPKLIDEAIELAENILN